MIRPNGINTNYSYDNLSRLLSVLHQSGTLTLDGASYTYDSAGNRTSKTDQLANVTSNYTYDVLSQLTQVTQGSTTTENYAYDLVGNRLSSSSSSMNSFDSSNALTSTQSATYTHDANGNITAKTDASGTTNYNWDFNNHLIGVVLANGGGTVSFAYDPFGRRIQKNLESAVNYVYDGDSITAELDSNGISLTDYTSGTAVDEPLAECRSGNVNYYLADSLGSITSLTDSTGRISQTYTYDSFGKIAASTGSVTNAFRYTGREFDEETGLYYYRARYYDPETGRFLSEDPLQFGSDDSNFYAYSFNNPIDFKDPSGLDAFSIPPPGPEPVPPPNPPPSTITINLEPAAIFALAYYDARLAWDLGRTLAAINNENAAYNEEMRAIGQYNRLMLKQADARDCEWRAYKQRCDQQAPPGLGPCEKRTWELQRNIDCRDMRFSWDKKWQPGRHDNDILELGIAIERGQTWINNNCK